MVAPGLVDLQVNGFMGVDFNTSDLTEKNVRELLPVLAARGITSFYPTLVTGSPDRISRALASITGVMEDPHHYPGTRTSREHGTACALPAWNIDISAWLLRNYFFCRESYKRFIL